MAVISLGMSQHCGSSVLEEKKRKKTLFCCIENFYKRTQHNKARNRKSLTFSLRDEFKSGTNLVQVTLQSVLVTHLNKYNDNCNIFDWNKFVPKHCNIFVVKCTEEMCECKSGSMRNTDTQTGNTYKVYSEIINPSRLNVALITMWFESLDSSRQYKSARNTKLQEQVVVKVTNHRQGIYIVKQSKNTKV